MALSPGAGREVVEVLFLENVFLAFSSLRANKMRSLLTMLGIIIGIGSVIAIVTVGNSLTNSITSSMESMGANNISVGLQQKRVEEEKTESGLTFRGVKRRAVMTDEDMFTDEMLDAFSEKFADKIKDISIEQSLGSGTVEREGNIANVSISGVNSGYVTTNELDLLWGNTLSKKALDGGKAVAVVSDYLVNNLFDGDNEAAIGQTVEVVVGRNFYYYTIVGVYEYSSSSLQSESDEDVSTAMYVPLLSVQKNTHSYGKYSDFTVVVNSGIDSEIFIEEIEHFFDRYYRKNERFTISVFSMESLISELTSMLSTISLAISVIAGISLLVGGIGVMNIMLVSISERTREIGTRKALGATNSSIRVQFIVEAMVICLVGGMIGIALGISGGAVGAKALGYEATASITSIVVSLMFSLGIGVFFGYYPANKAAKMNPIDALRYE